MSVRDEIEAPLGSQSIYATSSGLTLRDYFAAQAVVSLVRLFGGVDPGEVAKRAYEFADAMLQRRESGSGSR